MGWWRCNENGGIDWETKKSLVNAIPGHDTPKEYYNGDAPADYMSVPMEVIKMWFKNRSKKPTTEQLIELFVNNKISKVFNFIDPVKLKNLVSSTWDEIDRIYKNAWGRPAYKQERYYVCKFVFRCIWD